LGLACSLECGTKSLLSKAQRTARNPLAVPLQLWSIEHVYLCLVAFQAALKMSEEKALRVCIKFCVKLGEKRCEDFLNFNTAFGDECLNRAHTCEWIKLV
jgi:hypothetical protein